MAGAIVWHFHEKATAARSPLFLKARWGRHLGYYISVSPLFQILEITLPSLNLRQSPKWIQYTVCIQPLLPSRLLSLLPIPSSSQVSLLLSCCLLVYFGLFCGSLVCSEQHWTDDIQKSSRWYTELLTLQFWPAFCPVLHWALSLRGVRPSIVTSQQFMKVFAPNLLVFKIVKSAR